MDLSKESRNHVKIRDLTMIRDLNGSEQGPYQDPRPSVILLRIGHPAKMRGSCQDPAPF